MILGSTKISISFVALSALDSWNFRKAISNFGRTYRMFMKIWSEILL